MGDVELKVTPIVITLFSQVSTVSQSCGPYFGHFYENGPQTMRLIRCCACMSNVTNIFSWWWWLTDSESKKMH